MSIFQAILLGALQGLTEFLPVSSSGHLTIFSKWFFSVPSNLSFDIAVHAASLIAILIYFRKDIAQIIKEIFEKNFFETLFFKLILGSVPAALVGFLFLDKIEKAFSSSIFAAWMLYITALLLIFAEVVSKRTFKNKKENPGLLDSLFIGFFQAVAVLPGISRSGSTISGGMLRGLSREASARFSFLLVIPAVSGSILIDLLKGKDSLLTATALAGFLSSLLFSLAALKFLLKYVKKHSFYPFAVYCAALATVFLVTH